MIVSEVALIRERIANEYKAAAWGLSGLACGLSRHAFITAKMERIGEEQQHLAQIVGEQEAMKIVAETLLALPEKPERSHIPALLISLRGDTEATAHLIEYIREMWETIDLLRKEFGVEDAQKIILASGMITINISVL